MTSYDTLDPRRERLFRLILLALIFTILIGGPLLLIKPFKKLTGKGLNRRAWQASYSERNLTIPPDGKPREGFWGVKLTPVRDPQLQFILPERHRPGEFEIDRWGRQYARSAQHPDLRILIIGGSVAAGAYASRLNQTYFNYLAHYLGQRGYRVEIAVQAAGAWVSLNELNALRYRGVKLRPDYVVFLSGLNDLILRNEMPMDERVRQYLMHMREARDLALAHGSKVIFSPQPFLPQKPEKTGMEVMLQFRSYRPIDELVKGYIDLRQGLRAMVIPGQVYFMDCSGAFDRESHTVFSDMWHFSDVGHSILGSFMATNLDPILYTSKHAKGV